MSNDSNFEALRKMGRVAGPPARDAVPSPLKGYSAGRAEDGRTARRTGRDAHFSTIVTPDFKRWLKIESARLGKPMGAVLDDMREAYEEKYGRERSP